MINKYGSISFFSGYVFTFLVFSFKNNNFIRWSSLDWWLFFIIGFCVGMLCCGFAIWLVEKYYYDEQNCYDDQIR
jgi:hypothetical protein